MMKDGSQVSNVGGTMMNVNYTKVDVNDPAVVALATEMNATTKEVAAIINQQRYRSAYNRLQLQRMKVVRRLVKEHPELLEGGK